MTMFAEVRRRFHSLLQERTDNVDLQANELMQFQEALSALALKRRFTQITHIPAIQGVALYALPPNTVDVCQG